MPSKTNTNATAKSATPVVRDASRSLNKRQARAAQRAAERQRRNMILSGIAGFVIVLAIIFLFASHQSPNKAANNKTVVDTNGAACPTATTVTGPTSIPTPALTPPALPANAKTVNGDQGLQYVDITEGCGPEVKSGDNINVIYTGWLQKDGHLFDSSLSHTDQMPNGVFNVQNIGQAQLIDGWNKGIIGMKPGGTRRLIIPAALGYGDQGSPPTIPGGATLVFDITLVSIGS